MTLPAWITLVVVVATVVTLARDLLPPALAVLGATILLLVLGVIDSDQALSGFSNEAPVTVAALYVLARAVELSGILQPVVGRLMGSTGSPRSQLARIVGPVAAASGFLNNTPLVAMTVPPIVEWANRKNLSASRFLLPLSYAAVLGGAITAIGTSTNLVVSGLLAESGMAPLRLFELSPVGLPIAVAGCVIMVALAPILLPERAAVTDPGEENPRSFTLSMRVVPGGPLDRKSIEDAGLRDLQGVYLVEVERAGAVMAPVAPTETLHGDDVLVFAGKVDQIVDLQRLRGLVSTESRQMDRLGGSGQVFFEAVVGSDLAGQTLKDVGFRNRYQAAVLAIHRADQRLDAKLGEVTLRLGDTLLVLSDPGFRERWRGSSDFLLVAWRGGAPPRQVRKAPIVGLVAAAVILLAGTNALPILQASLVAAGVLIAIGALSIRQARNAVDLDVIIVIAASFGLGAAVTDSGLAEFLAQFVLNVSSSLGAIGALGAILLATMALTEFISNNAAAVLMFPIAMSTANAVAANPRPFAIAVALGASLSFLTPVGYQTNLMVYGLGGYRFFDYTRFGIPLNLACVTLCMLLIPRVFPL